MGVQKFEYDGPILSYDKVICEKWKATTFAISKNKAINNLKFQANKHLGRTKNNKLTLLPERLVEDKNGE